MNRFGFLLGAIVCAAVAVHCGVQTDLLLRASPSRLTQDDPVEARARDLVTKMTLDEKISLVHGTGGAYTGNTPAITRLGIPALTMNDGPQGFRAPDDLPGTSTAFPAALAVSATFDPALSRAYGAAMGQEFLLKGSNVLLGPAMCVARVPVNGRNFEYSAGEDPVLGSAMVAPLIEGIQEQGVIANAKHFIMNSQEWNRQSVSEEMSDRTIMELYMPPFIASVEAGVGSFMCSYNKINGTYACENEHTLSLLKKYARFDGWVMSDWGATHSTTEGAMAGLDQEMPGGDFFGDKLKQAVQSGAVPLATLDDKIMRMLRPMIRVGLLDRPALKGTPATNVTSVEHNQLARRLAAEGTVLLKNDHSVLPLDPTLKLNIAVLGSAAQDAPISHGGGSGQVIPAYTITPLMGVRAAARPGSTVTYVPTTDLDGAVAAARAADVAVVVVATTSSEGGDRKGLGLDQAEVDLIAAVAAASKRVVVCAVAPGALLTPWAESVSGVLVQFMPGQEYGNALADVLFGKVNPSGRLPVTFPNKENEVGFTQEQYPGLPASNPTKNLYTEGLEIGYRWYTAHGVTPAFPFGHGLSYAAFEYSSLAVDGRKVTVQVKNTGAVPGAEVPQLYVTYPAAAGEPPLQLRSFQKVLLKAGESAPVGFLLADRDLSVWDEQAGDYRLVRGDFAVHFGASSGDLRQTAKITV